MKIKTIILLKAFVTAAILVMAQAADAQAQAAVQNSNILEGAKNRSGFINVYETAGKYYFSIPDTLLGRDILIVNRVKTATANTGLYAGGQIGQLGEEKIIRFERGATNKINLLTISYKTMPADTASAMYRAVSNSNQQPVTTIYEVLPQAVGGNLIEVTDLLKTGSLLAGGPAKEITSVRAYPTNIEVSAIRHVPFTPQPKGTEGAPAAETTGTGGEMEMNSSLLLLPKIPMQPRYSDNRVGYFRSESSQFTAHGLQQLYMIHRWRLEPQGADMETYKNGGLVEPKKPIVFYIDPATPKIWVPYLLKGISNWQPAFEKAGFKNAIMGRLAPTKYEDSTWDINDATHSAIVYKPSSVPNAMGYHIVDPRSGEILESHIEWFHNIIKWLHDRYLVEAGPNDPRAGTMQFADTLMGRLIEAVATHEVGHAVGLLHNFGASSTVPVDSLRSRAWVAANGISPSIMDYARYNYVAQPQDSMDTKSLVNRMGDYEHWAIEWGYRLLPQYKNASGEKAWLRQWASQKLQNPRLWWGDGENVPQPGTDDPRSQKEDLGDDPVKAGDYAIQNLQRVVASLPKWAVVSGENYGSLTNMYHAIVDFDPNNMGVPLGAYSRYLLLVAKNIGGRYRTPKVAENAAPVYESIPKNRQKAAVDFLNRQLFATPHWLLDTAIVSKTGDNTLWVIGNIQATVLRMLLGQNVYNLIKEETMAGTAAYSAIDMLDDLKKGIWGELATHKPIDVYRRNLQKKYTTMVADIIKAQGGVNEFSGVARGHFITLHKEVAKALPATKDATTQYHLQDVLGKIEDALK